MHPTRHLAHCVEAINGRAVGADDLCARIDLQAAHCVMHARCDLYRVILWRVNRVWNRSLKVWVELIWCSQVRLIISSNRGHERPSLYSYRSRQLLDRIALGHQPQFEIAL